VHAFPPNGEFVDVETCAILSFSLGAQSQLMAPTTERYRGKSLSNLCADGRAGL